MLRRILTVIFVLVALPYVLKQVRKPSRWLGRLFAIAMNVSHGGLTDWGLAHVAIGKRSKILDVGCGGGRTIQRMAAVATEGSVVGVDHAAGSVATARATNARLIAEGRVDVRQASVSTLPFEGDRFDLVTAIETHYYWPDLSNDVREILRVLKPEGTLVIVAESYKGGRFDAIKGPVMKLLKSSRLTVEDHRALFVSAGFSDVQTFEERSKGWLCVTGRKPVAPTTAGDPA